MVKVYAIVLVLGVIGLLVMLMGGVFMSNVGKPEAAPGERWGPVGKSMVGGILGFGMGGMSAEFAPLELAWPAALAIAVVAAALSVFWVRYATRQLET